MIDALIIGYHDVEFAPYVQGLRGMGEDSGAFKDLDLAFLDHEGTPLRALDLMTRFFREGKAEAPRPFHNCDFLWPTITYLGSYLTKRGFTFDYVNLFHHEQETLKQKLLRGDVRTVAITTTLYVTPQPILEIIALVRRHNARARIVVGGPFVANQAATCDADTLQGLFTYVGADFYVNSSEGEAAFVKLLEALRDGGPLDAIDNIAYRHGDRFVVTQRSTESNPLSDNPIDYRLFPPEAIGAFVSLRTAKSCPFTCAFCGFPKRAGAYQYLPVSEVERELDALAAVGTVTTLTFLDDTFNVPKGRFKELLRMMIRRQYGFKWNSFYRCDHGDEEAIALMAESGCEGVFLGVESGSDSILAGMNKSARRKDYLRAIPLFRRHGISTDANLIVGYPGETVETVQETIDLIEEARPDFYRAQLWYADPMTPVWEHRDELGIKGEAFNWSHHTMDSKTACDLIDRMFLSIEHSIWMPQNGFEQWSTFYLQRRGMSVDQVKSFLICFNDGIKEKLLHPGRRQASPAVIDRIRRSSQYDRPGASPLPALSMFPGGAYKAAERYFLSEVAAGNPHSNVGALVTEADTRDPRWASVACAVGAVRLDDASPGERARWADVLLAAYGVVLSRVDGRADTLIAVSERAAGRPDFVAPVRLSPAADLTFADLVATVTRAVDAASTHAAYGFLVVTNERRLRQHGLDVPRFDVGYRFAGDGEGIEDGWETLRERYADVADGLALVLDVRVGAGAPAATFRYREGRLDRAIVEDLAGYFEAILADACANPQQRVDAIGGGTRVMETVRTAGRDDRDDFTF